MLNSSFKNRSTLMPSSIQTDMKFAVLFLISAILLGIIGIKSVNPATATIYKTNLATKNFISWPNADTQINSDAPDLGISMINNQNNEVMADDIISYTIVISNTGNQDATNVIVTSTIPITSLNLLTVDRGGIISGTNVIWKVDFLAVGQQQIFNLILKLSNPLYDNSITITSKIEAVDDIGNNIDINPTNNITQNTVVVHSTINLTIQKFSNTENITNFSPKMLLTYTLAITNMGKHPISQAILTNIIPAHTHFISASNQPIITIENNIPIIFWTDITLPVASIITRSVTVQIDDNIPPTVTTILNDSYCIIIGNDYSNCGKESIIFFLTPSLEITGPHIAIPNEPTVFVATIQFSTIPITYIWEATEQSLITHTGGISDIISFSWDTHGSKIITLTVQNNQGQSFTDTYDIDAVDNTVIVCVIDDYNQPISNTLIYYQGQYQGITNSQGFITLTKTITKGGLVAMNLVHTEPTSKTYHTLPNNNQNFAYQVYQTNIKLEGDGDIPQLYDISYKDNLHVIQVSSKNILVLFNLVVSVEWDANIAYINNIKATFQQASNYLYDVSDGQMAFGWLTIYDRSEKWGDADFQFVAANTAIPSSQVGGLLQSNNAIRVGRGWNGIDTTGNWSQPNGYRTLIHQFGHYGLNLYDEYFYTVIDRFGNFLYQKESSCMNENIKQNNEDATNASIMYWQYNASELADSDRWSEKCQLTEQYRINRESDWQTVLRHYQGLSWTITTPVSRGMVMTGPNKLNSNLLPFPIISLKQTGSDPITRHLVVKNELNQPIENAWVLVDGFSINQGVTNASGEIEIYGAAEGYRLHTNTLDGKYKDNIITITNNITNYQVVLEKHCISNTIMPYISLTPQPNGGLYLRLLGLDAGYDNLWTFIESLSSEYKPVQKQIIYSNGNYNALISANNINLGANYLQITSNSTSQQTVDCADIAYSSDFTYNLLQIHKENSIFSLDGNLKLQLPAESLLSINEEMYATITRIPTLPNIGSHKAVGSGYEIRIEATNLFERQGNLQLSSHLQISDNDMLSIYRWDELNELWEKENSTITQTINGIVLQTPINYPGLYAIFNDQMNKDINVYLPMVVKK